MVIALGADHAGYALKSHLCTIIEGWGHEVRDFGTNSLDSVDYPDYAAAVAKAVGSGEVEWGILVCGSGIGVSITANKFEGVRAADCVTVEMAVLSRQHNNANVLTLGERLLDKQTAEAIVQAFLTTEFEGGRHTRRVEKIHSLSGC